MLVEKELKTLKKIVSTALESSFKRFLDSVALAFEAVARNGKINSHKSTGLTRVAELLTAPCCEENLIDYG